MNQRKYKKQRNVKLRRGSSFDVLLAIIGILTSAAFAFALLSFKVLPMKWVLMITLVLSILLIVLAFFSMVRTKRWINIVKRTVMILIIASTCIGSFFVWRTKDAIYSIGNSATTETAYILVTKDSSYQKQSDLADQSIMLHSGSDSEVGNQVREELDKSVSNIHYEKLESYNEMIDSLLEEDCDAIVMSKQQYDYMAKKDTDLSKQVRVLSEVKYTKEHVSVSDVDITKKPFVVFVSGMDEAGELVDLHSDVNMLLLVNPISNELKMISLPRDSYLPNPALEYGQDKLTHSGWFGVENTKAAVENLFQVEIDYYVKINFSSLIEVVDTLEGIQVDVQISFCEQDEYRSFAQEDLICLNQGPQTLNGKQALAYARHRDSYVDQDLSRSKAQVDIVKGIVKRLLSPSGITKVDTLLSNMNDYVMTNFSGDQISAFASSELEDGKGWSISSFTVSDYTFDRRVTATDPNLGALDVYLFSQDDVAEIREAINAFLEPQALSEFTFDLDDLHAKAKAQLQDNQVIYDDQAYDPH